MNDHANNTGSPQVGGKRTTRRNKKSNASRRAFRKTGTKKKTQNNRRNKCVHEMDGDYKNITAVINVKALKHNLEYLRKKSGTEVMPVLKANAYGHGIIEVAKICRGFGVRYIGVATLGEAMQIRDSGDKGRILGWLYDVHSDQVRQAVSKNIDVGIFDENHIDIISESLPANARANIHLFVDTGIDRNGVPYEDAIRAAVKIVANPKFNLVGVMSHLCCASTKNNVPTLKQLTIFRELRENLFKRNIKPELFHIAATNGILNYDVSDFTMVRSGAGFYGLDKHQNKNLTQALTLSSTVAQLKYVPKGVGIGYDRTYITHHKEYIAIILIGYADLLPLIPHEKLSVTINGTKRKVLGLESMDQIVVQARKGDKLGDIVHIFGDKKKGFTSAIDFAEPSKTTAFNIVTHMGNRVNRKYVF
jgi:alanine racemase